MKVIYFVIPCYNEEDVLEVTAAKLVEKVSGLIDNQLISHKSRITFVDDGSKDLTWNLIEQVSIKSSLN